MGKIVDIDPKDPEICVIKNAIDVLMSGGVIVYPTDTVYGLGANILNYEAVARVFKIKGRPFSKPLPVVVSSLEMAEDLAYLNVQAKRLIDVFWPGALTIVLAKKPTVPSIVVGGRSSVALRMPDHLIPLMILQMSNIPLVATSANKHGLTSPMEAEEAIRQVGGEVDLVLDSGKVRGQPSTIIDLTKKTSIITRNGPVTKEMLERIIGHVDD